MKTKTKKLAPTSRRNFLKEAAAATGLFMLPGGAVSLHGQTLPGGGGGGFALSKTGQLTSVSHEVEVCVVGGGLAG
ncbi:MAG: twin-arginine translocation signal domain-containing protein, partial [Opitutaceae bacterium]|nr:twin-arginine translocation signal domain-containing protein [Opitutaceae bacterium]